MAKLSAVLKRALAAVDFKKALALIDFKRAIASVDLKRAVALIDYKRAVYFVEFGQFVSQLFLPLSDAFAVSDDELIAFSKSLSDQGVSQEQLF